MPIFCKYPNCNSQAFYGDMELDNNNIFRYIRKFCKTHSNGSKYLNVKQCIDDNCKIFPTFGYETNKPMACLKHSLKDMKNVTTRKCKKCELKQPSFNLPNLAPQFCFDCKDDKMVNTKIKNIDNKTNINKYKRKIEDI